MMFREAIRRSKRSFSPRSIAPFAGAVLLASTLLGAGVSTARSATLLRSASSRSVSRESEFVFENAPFDECHASTLVDTPSGIVVAWFGGTREGDADVEIWVARKRADGWTPPKSVANGVQPDGSRLPCWNPVLFRGGPRLYLFYKVGPSPREWWGEVAFSDDDGVSWSKGNRLPDGILGPIKNKPILVGDQTLLCGSSTEDEGWRVHVEWTSDRGKTWHKSDPLNDRGMMESIQPTFIRHGDGRVQMLCRSRSNGRITTTTSTDQGRTWAPMETLDLPNPNSGIDAVTLANGRHVLVYNPVERGRAKLSVAVSDDGEHWTPVVRLEDEAGAEFSYPAIIQSADGKLHVTYTWKRESIRHVVIDPAELSVQR